QRRGGCEAEWRQDDTPSPSALDCLQCRHPAHTATSASFEPETPLRRRTAATIKGAQPIARTIDISSSFGCSTKRPTMSANNVAAPPTTAVGTSKRVKIGRAHV